MEAKSKYSMLMKNDRTPVEVDTLPSADRCKPPVSWGRLYELGNGERFMGLDPDEDLDLDLDIDPAFLELVASCFASVQPLPDTERGPLDGIGMGAECPSEARVSDPKVRRQLFRHLSGENKGSKREAQGYIYRDNKRLKTGAHKAFGSL